MLYIKKQSDLHLERDFNRKTSVAKPSPASRLMQEDQLVNPENKTCQINLDLHLKDTSLYQLVASMLAISLALCPTASWLVLQCLHQF